MKAFLREFIGFFVALFLSVFVYAQYSDYRVEAEVGAWCLASREKVIEINKMALEEGGINNISSRISPVKIIGSSHIETNAIKNDGTIIIQGGVQRQLLVLIPSFNKDIIEWKSYMSDVKLIPSACKKLPNK